MASDLPIADPERTPVEAARAMLRPMARRRAPVLPMLGAALLAAVGGLSMLLAVWFGSAGGEIAPSAAAQVSRSS